MKEEDVVKRIKEKHWDLRVRRPGFLQSKHIVSEAISQQIQITSSITVHETSNFWVGDINLYNQETTDKLVSKTFSDAFTEDPQWPLSILKKLREATQEKNGFMSRVGEIQWENKTISEKIQYLTEYVSILSQIQKYYAFAVPLTNWSEQKLKESDESLLEYAVQYEMLDVDKMGESLLRIKNASEEERDGLIDQHLKTFAWIKSNYNIIEAYTKEEVLKELESDIHVFAPKTVPEKPFSHFAIALQVGIFLRNSMKEMSQQLWFGHESFVKHIAKDLFITREDVLQICPHELMRSLENGSVVVSASELQDRHRGFVSGILDGEVILMTGSVVEELVHHFDSPDVADIKEIRGNVASKGYIVGIAKVIPNMSQISKLNDGEILVTSMTTPDFVVAMKRAVAIITDEGGLSCHAAIVARELNKPCIIGTGIASKVLKDGDEVEVDANTGLIKILRRA